MSAKKITYFGLLFLPAIIRIAVTIQHVHLPLFSYLRIDEVDYDTWSRIVMKGIFFHDYVPIHGPGYPWLLGVAYMIAGYHLLIPRIIQICLGLGSMILVQRITKRIAGEPASLVSALIFGFYWPPIIFEQRILDVTLYLFLNLLSLLLVLRAVETAEAKRPRSLLMWILSGLSIGATMLVRPTALFWLAGVLIWLVVRSAMKRSRQLAFGTTVLLISACILIVPVMAKNHAISQKWSLLQTNTGLNFYQGNNPKADGTCYARLGEGWDELESIPIKEKGITDPYEQERYYQKKVFDFLKTNPASFFWLEINKIGLLLNNKEIRATIDPEFHRHLFRALSIPLTGFGLILGLAFAGILAIRLSRSDHQLLLIYLVAHAAATLAVLVSSRYRMPFTAGLCILSGAGLMIIVQLLIRPLFPNLIPDLSPLYGSILRSASKLQRTVPVILFLAGFGISLLPIVPAHSDAEELTYLGVAWRTAGNDQKALTFFDEALKQEPGYANALVQIARIERKQGRLDLALQTLQKAEASEPKSSLVHYDLGTTLWMAGRKEEAIAQMLAAHECRPMWLDALKALAVFEWETGSPEKARQHVQMILTLDPKEKDALELLRRMSSR